MDLSHVHPCALAECLVMVLQIAGLLGLCLSRLMPSTPWGGRGRALLLIAILGLAAGGAFCGQQDSEFGLFAGGTITVLLIGMTVGGGAAPTSAKPRLPETVEGSLVG